jgi:hypothetical protein
MKQKLLILLVLAISATAGYSQGLYSEDGDSYSLFGEPASKEGTMLYAPRTTPQQEAGDPLPLGEGILLLAALAGVYLFIGNKTNRTR